MRLNTLKGSSGSKKQAKRVGRGVGSGFGKTCGRGHKGQKSRRGYSRNIGFEGGQMPLQRRLPKIGFNSRRSSTVASIRLHELGKLDTTVVDLATLSAANLISKNVKHAKIIASGRLDKALSVQGLGVTKGARIAIEAAGGKIMEDVEDVGGI